MCMYTMYDVASYFFIVSYVFLVIVFIVDYYLLVVCCIVSYYL